MAKCTLVTVLPFALTEEKPGLIPGYYYIPPAPKNDFSILVIKDGYHNVLIPLSDDKAPPMRVTDTCDQIADSLINDYTNACLAVNYEPEPDGSIATPGLFWLEGALAKPEILAKHQIKLTQANKNTKCWFTRLVKMADDDWAKYHQHRSISDLQRHACSFLNIQREWNFDVQTSSNILCWACKAMLHPAAIICGSCKAVINIEEYEKNKARFVPVSA